MEAVSSDIMLFALLITWFVSCMRSLAFREFSAFISIMEEISSREDEVSCREAA